MKRATLIYNATAGGRLARRDEQIQRAAEVVSTSGYEVKIERTTGPGSAEALARTAAQSSVDLILVCGGDGTINDVVNALAGSSTPLGILPGGTANIAAKELDLPEDPVEAAAQLPRWQPRRVALGRAVWSRGGHEHRRYFLSVAGIGFDAHVIRELSLAAKAELGVLAYILEAIRQAFVYRYPRFACRANGRETVATLAVAQRSRRYAGWLRVAPSGGLLDSRLASCMFRGRGPGSYVAYGFAVLLGQHLRLPDVEVAAGQPMVCRPKDPEAAIDFELDGELVGQLPATFDVVPEALTLLGPWKELETQSEAEQVARA